MTESKPRRRATKLSPETKWEIFLQVAAGEITQADAARKWQVDVSTVIGIRRTVSWLGKSTCVPVCTTSTPGSKLRWRCTTSARVPAAR